MRTFLLAAVLLASPQAHAAFDANGIALGASEAEVRKKFPSANCKKLEWESRAADRRCDDSRINFGGVEARVTFYLRRDKVEAFDVRFDSRDLDRFVAAVKERFGAPASEQRDTLGDKKPRQVYKALWEGKGERAALVAQIDKRRGSLLVSRGNFEEEIYKVR
jgi:hypothetical protein